MLGHDPNGERGKQTTEIENSNGIVSPAASAPLAPKELTPEEIEQLKTRSAEIANEIEQATGSREMEVIDSASALGLQAQKAAAAELGLLRNRVLDVFQAGGASQRVTNDLVDLKRVLSQINPSEVGRKGMGGLLSTLPLLKGFGRVLERIAIRYEDVSQQSIAIEKRLREGQMMLRRDNIELRKLYEHVEGQQLPIQRDAYLGTLLIDRLGGIFERTSDPQKRDRIQNA